MEKVKDRACKAKRRVENSSVEKKKEWACKAKKRTENPVYASAEKDKNCECIQLRRQTDPEFRSTERLKDSEKKKHKRQTDREECAAEINHVSQRLDFDQPDVHSNVEEYRQNLLLRAVEKFLHNTSEGPVYVCSSCYQTHFVQNVQRVSGLQSGAHQQLLEECLTGYLSKDNVEWICLTCKLDIYKDLVPKLFVKNKMGFLEKPEELCLFPLKETLIAPLIPFMTLRALPVCGLRMHGQKSIMGNVVHVPNDVSSTVQSLPRLLDDIGTVLMKLKRMMCYSTSVFSENVRPLKVVAALRYLMQNSAMYTQFNFRVPNDWLQHIATSQYPNHFFVEGHMPSDETESDGQTTQDEQSQNADKNTTDTENDEFESPLMTVQGNMDTMLTKHMPLSTYNDLQGTADEFGQLP